MDHDVGQDDQPRPDWNPSNLTGDLFDDLHVEDMPSFTGPDNLSASMNMPAAVGQQTSDMQMTSTAGRLSFGMPTTSVADQQPYGMLSPPLVDSSLLTFSDMAMPQQNVMASVDQMLDPRLYNLPYFETPDTKIQQLVGAQDRPAGPLPSYRNQDMMLGGTQSGGLTSLPTQQQMHGNQQVHPAQQLSSVYHQLPMASPTYLNQHPTDQYTYHYSHAPGGTELQMAENTEQHQIQQQMTQPQRPQQQLQAQVAPSHRQSGVEENTVHHASQPNQQAEALMQQQSAFTKMPAQAESGSEQPPVLPTPATLDLLQSQMFLPTNQNTFQAQRLDRWLMQPMPYTQYSMLGGGLAGRPPIWHQEQATGLAAGSMTPSQREFVTNTDIFLVHGPQNIINHDDGGPRRDVRQHVNGVNTVATVHQTSDPQTAAAQPYASTSGSSQSIFPYQNQGDNNSFHPQQQAGYGAHFAANSFGQRERPQYNRTTSADHAFGASTRPQNTSNLALPPTSAASNNSQNVITGAAQQLPRQEEVVGHTYPQFRIYPSHPPQASLSTAQEDRRDSSETAAAQAPAQQPAGKVPIPRAAPRIPAPSEAAAPPATPQTAGSAIAAAMGPTSQEHTIPPRPKPGRKPMPADKATDRRRTQNRQAQRNFRDKRTQKVEELKTEVTYLKEQLRSVQATLVQTQEQARVENAGLQAQLQEAQHAHQGTLSELRRLEEGNHRSERDERRSGRRSASPKNGDESSQTYPPHNYEKLKLPSITNHNADISVMTPPEDNEIDMTEVWMRSRPANHQQNNWTDFNADNDPVNNDSCGFCTDGGFCACKSAPPLPTTTEKRKISPGTCDMCQRDPKRAEACRSLNYEQDKAVETAPKTMSCGQFIDKFSQAKGRMPGITELFGPMRSFPAPNGGFNIDEREAAQVLSGLSQRTP